MTPPVAMNDQERAWAIMAARRTYNALKQDETHTPFSAALELTCGYTLVTRLEKSSDGDYYPVAVVTGTNSPVRSEFDTDHAKMLAMQYLGGPVVPQSGDGWEYRLEKQTV